MLKIENVSKTYAPTGGGGATIAGPALGGVSIHVKEGEFFTLLGPSGCGKTTLLQCIAGLEVPDAGLISMGGDVVYSGAERIFIPANRRRLGMVFQSYAIWPHMTVFENVAFPLRQMRPRLSPKQIVERVESALKRVHLTDFAQRPAPYLSGGQQQRVALARALVGEPRLILLDEPLSNLDAKLRDEMRVELRQLVKSLGITTVYVTHDQVEALSMSDRIAVLSGGRVVQEGTATEIYMTPTSEFTAQFVGRSNIIPATVDTKGGGVPAIVASFGRIQCTVPQGAQHGDRVNLMIRPHAIEVGERQQGENTFTAPVSEASFVGEFMDLNVQLPGCEIRVFASPYEVRETVHENRSITFRLPPDRCIVLRSN